MGKRGRKPLVALTPEVEEKILERLRNGERITKICEDEDMPTLILVMRRCQHDKEFEARYVDASTANTISFGWNQAIEVELLERLAGGESVTSICEDQHMPSTVVVFKRIAKDPEFAEAYRAARESYADTVFDQMIALADTAQDKHEAQAMRVKIDTRKWVLGRMSPKKYSEKVEHNVNLNVPTVVRVIEDFADEEPPPKALPEPAIDAEFEPADD